MDYELTVGLAIFFVMTRTISSCYRTKWLADGDLEWWYWVKWMQFSDGDDELTGRYQERGSGRWISEASEMITGWVNSWTRRLCCICESMVCSAIFLLVNVSFSIYMWTSTTYGQLLTGIRRWNLSSSSYLPRYVHYLSSTAELKLLWSRAHGKGGVRPLPLCECPR